MKTQSPPSRRTRIAFWPYDQYPYVLSGKITANIRQGPHFYYEIEGYGKGNLFAHRSMLAIIEGPNGERIAQQLKDLKAEHDLAIAAVNETWKRKARAILPFEPPCYLKPKP